MFITLPLFLSLGFIFGYALKKEREFAWAFTKLAFANRKNKQITFYSVLFLVVLLFVIFRHYWDYVTEHRAMIAWGSMAVGVATGLWFVKAKESDTSNVFKFIAGAGLVVMASALQYDTSLFNRIVERISKVDAVGVTIELQSGQGGETAEPLTRNQVDIFDSNGARWRGGDRLDYVIFSLVNLGDRQLRDEQFARIFASQMPNAPPVPDWEFRKADLFGFEPKASELAHEFVRYSCTRLSQLAAEMKAIQDVQRAEFIASPDLESLINHLRIFYFQALREGGPAPPTADVEKDVQTLKTRSEAEIEAAQITPGPPDPKKNLCVTSKIKPLDTIPTSPRLDKAQFQALGYVALTLALLEAATDDQEGAVQLLDREIKRQKDELQAVQADLLPPKEGCLPSDSTGIVSNARSQDCVAADVAQRQLTAYRRLVLIARLEDTQDGVMDSWRTRAIIPARVESLRRMVGDFSLALRVLRPQDVTSFAVFAHKKDDSDAERCLTAWDKDKLALLGRWSMIRAMTIANALESIVAAPELLHEDEQLQTAFDDYADYLSAFDTDCVKPYQDFDASVPRNFLKIAAEYWETRAGAMADDDSEDGGYNKNKLLALCKSRDNYGRGRKMFIQANASDDAAPDAETAEPRHCKSVFETPKPGSKTGCGIQSSMLDDMQGRLHDKIDEHTVRQAHLRVKSALKRGFPIAEVEKLCP